MSALNKPITGQLREVNDGSWEVYYHDEWRPLKPATCDYDQGFVNGYKEGFRDGHLAGLEYALTKLDTK